ncbi:MAG: P-loop NTPase fold protein [Nautiliaceae bacterium]
MKYLNDLENFGCKLVRSGNDFDFLLLKKENLEKIKKYLLNNEFILFKEEEKQLNFKKFENGILIDIDINFDIETKFFHTYFYDVFIKGELKLKYFQNPLKYKNHINCIRYMFLLRGFNRKYLKFFLEHKDFILENGYCLKYLTKSPFKKEFESFDDFLNVIKRNWKYMIKYIKFKYLIRYVKVKFFKKRGKVIAFIGVDGSGKSTVIKILKEYFGYKTFYLGDRSIKFSKLYKIKYLKPISIFIQYFEKLFRVLYIKLLTLKGNHILTDRYYFENNISGTKGIIYNILYNKLFIKPDIVVVLWADSEEILKRKKEMSKKDIEKFNKSIDNLPFKNKVIIKNVDLDSALNQILKVLK